MTVGIVAGLAAELDAFAPGVARESVAGPLPVVRLRWVEREVVLCCAGIGKGAAASAATWLHARHGANALMTIGTAGALRDVPAAAYRITHAVQHDYGARRPERFARYTAGTMPVGPVEVRPFAAKEVSLAGVPTARIASGDAFVASQDHAAEIAAALDADLVDMETAAVAQVAELFGLPWLAAKATTDRAAEDSAELFARNLQAAAEQAARLAERLIAELL